MLATIIQAEGIKPLLVDAGLNPNDVTEIEAKGLAGEVMSAAILALSTGMIAAVAKVVVELIRKEKSFAIKINGEDVDFSAKNMSQKEVEAILASFEKQPQ